MVLDTSNHDLIALGYKNLPAVKWERVDQEKIIRCVRNILLERQRPEIRKKQPQWNVGFLCCVKTWLSSVILWTAGMWESFMVIPGLSLSIQCSHSCSFPGVLQCPQAVTCSGWRVQLTTSTCGTIQCTNESQPWLGIEMPSCCCNSSTNMNNNNFSNYFPPFHLSVWATRISTGHA